MGFFEGGNKSISFGKKGDNSLRNVWQGGVVLNIGDPVDSMSFTDPTATKKFKSGEVVKKIILALDTKSGQHPAPPLDEEDDGVRDWHVDKGSGQARSIAAALRKGGQKDVFVGDQVYTRWTTGEGEVGDPRVFETIIIPGVKGMGAVINEGPAPQAQPQQATMPPQVAPSPAPARRPKFDPETGQPITYADAQPAAVPRFPKFNPETGQAQDPYTGMPLAQAAPPAQGSPVTNPYRQ